MLTDSLVDEDKAILDEYYEKIVELSSCAVPDYKERETVYTAVALLFVERIQYVRRCDPNNSDTINIVNSHALSLATILIALGLKHEDGDVEDQIMNVNFFLEKLYKGLCDPLTFSFVVTSGIVTMIKLLGSSAEGNEVDVSTLVDLVNKAREDGKDIQVFTKDGEGETRELSEEDLDDLISTWKDDGDHDLH